MKPDPDPTKNTATGETASPQDGSAEATPTPANGDAVIAAIPTGLEEESSIEIEFIQDEPEADLERADGSSPVLTGEPEAEPGAIDEAPPNPDQQRIASLTRLVARGRFEMDHFQDEIEALKTEREQLQREARALAEQAEKRLAESASLRAQLEKKLEDQLRDGAVPLLKDLMTVVDHLDFALRTSPAADPLYQGIEMTRSELINILKRNGAEPIEAVGAPFNPRWHEASAAEYRADLQVETCIDDLRRGWQRSGRVLRPTLVRVGKPAEKKE